MVNAITLSRALRVDRRVRMAIVGSGGKTTLMFRLARELEAPVIVTTSTHLSVQQAGLADAHFIIRSRAELEAVFQRGIAGVTLLTGEVGKEQWLTSLPVDWLAWIAEQADALNLPVLVEADGSRCLPLKAPAGHEPAIPAWANHVAVVAGLSGLGHPLDPAHVHRPELFAALGQLAPGAPVSPQALQRVLAAPQGGLKNVPPGARKTVVLNQADGVELQAVGAELAQSLLPDYDQVLVGALQDPAAPVKAVYTRVAAVILAAGKSSRMGGGISKVLMDWQGEPFVRRVARTALEAGLSPVVVVAGAQAAAIQAALQDLPVSVVQNLDWQDGQSTSLRCGLNCLPESCGGAIFLLADQPQMTVSILTALVEQHRATLAEIVAPLIGDRRANPVLFDHSLFKHLAELTGDTGGRALFSRCPVRWLAWQDERLLFDVDTPEDYRRLLENGS